MRVPSGWGLESPSVFTHPSRAGSNLEAGLPGTVVQIPVVAWAPARGSQSTCSQEGRRCRLVLYDGCSLRSHLASLCLFSVDQSGHKPPRIQGEGTQTPHPSMEGASKSMQPCFKAATAGSNSKITEYRLSSTNFVPGTVLRASRG